MKFWKESIKEKKEENVTAPSCIIAETQVEVVLHYGENLDSVITYFLLMFFIGGCKLGRGVSCKNGIEQCLLNLPKFSLMHNKFPLHL